jgi:hypothetical protein
VYAWIWRHLPFGLPGKIIGSLVLVAAVVALLWFKVFAMVEPLLPNNDGQVENAPTSAPAGGIRSGPGPAGDDVTATGNPGSTIAVTLRPRPSQSNR